MKLIKFDNIARIPASHEDADDPEVFKKVLFRRDDLFVGGIQMINWAFLPAHKSFHIHYHKDMQELFIMINPGAVAVVDGKDIVLDRGDALVVDPGESHEMKNPTKILIEYIVIGIA